MIRLGALSLALNTMLLSVVAATVALAELKPLNETLSTQTEKSYEYLRCAAFYTANLEWAGTQLSEEVYSTTRQLASSLLTVAILVRSSTNDADFTIISAAVLKDTRAVADLYLEQFRGAYAQKGNAWSGNQLWESDATYCKPVGAAASELVSSMETSK